MPKRNALKTSRKYYTYERILLDSVDSDGFEEYPYYSKLENEKEKAAFILGRFKSEYQGNVDRIGVMEALVEWLQGLSLNIPFMHYEIIKLRESFEGRKLSDKEQEKTCEQYWKFMAMRLQGIFKSFNLGV